MSIRTVFDPTGATIWADSQHLSRLTHEEVREIVLQCVVFGRKKLREEVRTWLNGGTVEDVAQFLSKENTPTV